MQNLFKILFERSISILIFIFPFTNMCYFFGKKVFLSVGNKALKVFFVQNIIPLTKFYEQNLYFSFAVMIALFICCARGNLKFLSTFSRYNIICAILLDIICNMVGPIYLYLPTGIKEGTLAIICINSMFLGVMLAIFYSILLISFGRLPAIPVLTQAAKLQMQRAQS